MKYNDYYATLALEPGCSDADIRKAYRRLARRYHPDVSKEPDAEARFKEISEAYQTLSDPEKRQAYDQLGRHQPGEEFQPGPEWDSRFWQGGGAQELDLSDLFEQIGFRRAAQRQAGASPANLRGQDYELATSLTLDEAANGKNLAIEFQVPELGPDGRIERRSKTARIRIPKGVSDGERLRVPGRGGAGIGNGKPGDLYLDLRLEPHPLFQVVGHDLYVDLPLAPWEAALGGTVDVPTLTGRVQMTVPAGARGGQKLRLAGKGLPRRQEGAGDLFCVLQILTPSVLSAREKELFAELASISTFEPRAHLHERSSHA
jgi:curved DNA-binding protein